MLNLKVLTRDFPVVRFLRIDLQSHQIELEPFSYIQIDSKKYLVLFQSIEQKNVYTTDIFMFTPLFTLH
jgi:hypothetical protein